MAERRSGPIKPPVIEAKAKKTTTRPALDTPPKAASEAAPEPVEAAPEKIATEKTENGPADDASKSIADLNPSADSEPVETKTEPSPTGRPLKEKAKDSEPAGSTQKPVVENKVRERPALMPMLACAIAGGVIGLALAYGIAAGGLWPDGNEAAGPELAALRQQFGELAEAAETERNNVSTLREDINRIVQARPAAPVDIAPLEERLADLSQRLDALEARPAPADSGVPAPDLSEFETRLDALAQDVTGFGQGRADMEQNLAALGERVEVLQSQVQANAAEPSPEEAIGPALRLPLVLSGLEAALGSARPFAAELDSLRQIVPDAQVPQSLIAAAQKGLVPPSILSERFARALPDIYAAHPVDPNANWQDRTLDWFRTILALRPSGEIEGDDPQAVLARLEQAMERRDMTAAAELFQALPEKMRDAAGTLPGDVRAQADAGAFIADLRVSALEPARVAK